LNCFNAYDREGGRETEIMKGWTNKRDLKGRRGGDKGMKVHITN
jgi:hypothetical protein